MSTRVALALLFCLGVAPAASPGRRMLAAPEIIVLSGGPLKERVILRDWSENHRLLVTAAEVAAVALDSLRGRPRIHVAMYWGSHWRGRTDVPDSMSAGGAIVFGYQSGAFYPSFRGKPATWVFGPVGMTRTSVRTITSEGLRILSRHGVPVVAK